MRLGRWLFPGLVGLLVQVEGGRLTAQTPAPAAGFDRAQVAPGMKVFRPDFSTFPAAESCSGPELEALATAADRAHPEYGLLPWDAPCSDCLELPSRRTATGRYFAAAGSGGTRFFVQEAAGPLHFRGPRGEWLTRDPLLRPTADAGVYSAPSQELPTGLDLGAGRSWISLADGLTLRFAGAVLRYGESGQGASRVRFDARAPRPWSGLAVVDPSVSGSVQPAQAANAAPPAHPVQPAQPANAAPPAHPHLAGPEIGRHGMRLREAWTGADLVQVFREGSVETDFVLRDPAALPEGERLVFQDRWELPAAYTLREDPASGSWLELGSATCWSGDLVLSRGQDGPALLRVRAPLLYDAARARGPIGYRWWREGDELVLETVVEAAWLRAPQRAYPVTVDPLLYGVATYTGGEIGFNYDPTCFDLGDFCSRSLTVTVPGRTTLTGAWFDAQYFSVLGGCIAGMTDCLMREAAFQIVGPCDVSPSPGGTWSCLPPEGDSSGTCFGDSLPMFATISCIPPSCEDHVLTFEMRTFHCSCNGPNCGVVCHFMPENTWKITIEGRTVEENLITSPDEPDFTICLGDTLALTPTAQWGVPPYSYQWSPGGFIGDTLFASPPATTTFSSVVFDQCGNTDTVFREVVVLPLPALAPGPFADCVPSVTLDAGGGFVSYFWPHSGETSASVVVDTPGEYVVEVTDANGCTGLSEPIEAQLYEPPVVTAVPDTVLIDEGALAVLGVLSTSPGPVSYTWSPPGTLTCSNCPSPLAFPQEPTVYYVVGELFGCVGQPDSLLVLVNRVRLVLPNAFTPNGDGLNDVFRVTNPSLYPAFEMLIFNRWGEEVFRSDDILSGWDGTWRGRNQETGIYIWMIRYRRGQAAGEEVVLRGNVTLLR